MSTSPAGLLLKNDDCILDVKDLSRLKCERNRDRKIKSGIVAMIRCDHRNNLLDHLGSFFLYRVGFSPTEDSLVMAKNYTVDPNANGGIDNKSFLVILPPNVTARSNGALQDQ
mmetsp:Transcript_26751/g.39571  ORF Transcript_26751/g.39571 Transcript_26751/m.39571 type:complete len:113 (+) Transcript_26751:1158-1496(+)